MKIDDFRLLASTLHFLKSGEIEVRTAGNKSLVVTVKDGTIDFDFLDAGLLSTNMKRKGLLESLQQVKDVGKALAEKELTISFSRKSKPVLRIGRSARPSLSRMVTRSKDIQVLNVKELRALDRELLRQKNG